VVKLTAFEFKVARMRLGYTQAELAEIFGVHQNTIARWSNGRVRIPKTAIDAMQQLLAKSEDMEWQKKNLNG
jgi:transcriptional regulator with XRE-family HTH domain